MPHVIELFVADHCPGSPDASIRLREFAASRHDIVIVELNIEDHLDEARHYGLFSTPAIVLDGSTVLYGVPTSTQLAVRCARLRAPAAV